MALILREGDYVPDGKGGFQTAEGSQELLERILWKLSVRRGSFPFLPELGSRLHLLGRAAPGQRASLARQYVSEALSDEHVEVCEVTLEEADGAVQLIARIEWQGEELAATVRLEGSV
ncbi:MAG: hypothetical protein VB096_00555 [Pseudoflavonifractor sp.]|nr:hypothetical protein [Pseudoflavonifractor sp.]